MFTTLWMVGEVPNSPILIDLADMQLWQGIVGLIAVLGLSPAPWLLGLALGRIQFTAPSEKIYNARIVDLKEASTLVLTETMAHHDELDVIGKERYADLKESRNFYRDASKIDRERADKATATVAEVLDVVKATNHVLTSLNEVVTARKEAAS